MYNFINFANNVASEKSLFINYVYLGNSKSLIQLYTSYFYILFNECKITFGI